MPYEHYHSLKLTRPEPGILEIVMGEEGKLSVADARTHQELAEIWRDIDADPEVSVAVIRGARRRTPTLSRLSRQLAML